MSVAHVSAPVLITGVSHSGKTPLRLALAACPTLELTRDEGILDRRPGGPTRWGLQHKGLERRFSDLVSSFPNLRMLILVRDARARASVVRHRTGSLGWDLATWERSAQCSLHLVQSSDQVRLIRYEDLLSNPAQTLREICAFVDIKFASEMLDEVNERLKTKLYVPDESTTSMDTFITKQCGPTLQRLGYDTEIGTGSFRPADRAMLGSGRLLARLGITDLVAN